MNQGFGQNQTRRTKPHTFEGGHGLGGKGQPAGGGSLFEGAGFPILRADFCPPGPGVGCKNGVGLSVRFEDRTGFH